MGKQEREEIKKLLEEGITALSVLETVLKKIGLKTGVEVAKEMKSRFESYNSKNPHLGYNTSIAGEPIQEQPEPMITLKDVEDFNIWFVGNNKIIFNQLNHH